MTTATTQVFRTSNVFLSPAMLIIAVVVITTISATVIADLASASTPAQDWAFALSVLAFVALLLGAACISHHRIEIHDQTVTLVWFPAYRKSIPAGKIVSVSVKSVNPWHNGLGIRFIGDSTLALINRGGNGVLITTEDNRRYLVVVRHPQELAGVIRRIDGMIQRN